MANRLLPNIKTWLFQQQKNTKLKRYELELLLLSALKVDRSWLFSHSDEPLKLEQINILSNWIKLANSGKPIAYIIGFKAFWTLNLKVTKDTLIPRPETEQIIELALEIKMPLNNILDLGTGTGAIALSLATEFSDSHVMACDFSKSALNVAKFNANQNKITNVTFIESNWFSAVPSDYTFDLIVSNPPYIDPQDCHLRKLEFEPISALVSENKGLKDLQTIIENAEKYLKPKGVILLEHGYNQKTEVQQMLKINNFQSVQTYKDLSGHDRITQAFKK